MKAVKFSCPNDGEQVLIEYLAYVNREVRLFGHCTRCQQPYSFMLDMTVSQLFDYRFVNNKSVLPN